MNPTKYDDVNEVLGLLSANLREFLGEKLVALYLTGSLAYGDFDYESSDIDFLAVLSSKLTTKELETVREMHKRIGQKVPYWAKRLEGSYVPQKWLNSIQKPNEKRPYVNAGIVAMSLYGNEWWLELYVLYEWGVALVGQNPKKLIRPVDIQDVREASRRILLEEWQPKLKEKNPFIHPKYESGHLQAYAILTMCRILHMAKVDTMVSKRKASSWVKKTYQQWASLIEEAENWKHGIKLNKQKEARSFIKFVVGEVEN